MKKSKLFRVSISFLLVAVFCSLALFYAIPKLSDGRKNKTVTPRVISVWNVDTFEGGKGSRTTFLSGVASRFEKETGNVYVLTSAYTKEGAKAALDEGLRPDILSYGVGFPAPEAKKTVAWCRGGYAVFSLKDDFSNLTASTVVLSDGGENLPEVAACLLGLTGEVKKLESTAAYLRFLAGDFPYLLGTQRDICRFISRGVNVYAKPLDGYCDLYQHAAILREENYGLCEAYLSALLCAKNQARLVGLGMLSPYGEIYGSEGGLHVLLEQTSPKRTLARVADSVELERVSTAAYEGMKSGNVEVLKNFLKEVGNTSKK